MARIKWARVFANAGYTFFSVLVASCTLGALLKLDVPLMYFLELSGLVAGFNAGLAFFAEIKREVEEKPRERCEHKVPVKEAAPDPPPDKENDGHPMTKLVNAILTF